MSITIITRKIQQIHNRISWGLRNFRSGTNCNGDGQGKQGLIEAPIQCRGDIYLMTFFSLLTRPILYPQFYKTSSLPKVNTESCNVRCSRSITIIIILYFVDKRFRDLWETGPWLPKVLLHVSFVCLMAPR